MFLKIWVLARNGCFTVSFLALVNWYLMSFFVGDPFSLNLFVIVMEALNYFFIRAKGGYSCEPYHD